MNRMIITVTDTRMTIKCKTDDKIKDFIKNSHNQEVEVYDCKRDITYKFKTLHHPDINKTGKRTFTIYIDGVEDEWTVPIGGGWVTCFTRDEIENLIPRIDEALHMLIDKVENKLFWILDF